MARYGPCNADNYNLKILSEWINDKEIRSITGEVYPMTEKEFEEFYEKAQKTEDSIWFVILDKEKDLVIGETGFLRIFIHGEQLISR